MKKIFLIVNVIFFILLLSITANAQYSVGINGGVGIGNAIPVYNKEIAYNYRISGKAKISQIFYAKGEIAFESISSSDNIAFTDINGELQEPGTITQTFQVLSFPILAGINFGNRVNYFFNAGPYLGYLLKQYATFDGDSNIFTGNLDNTKNYNRYGLGLLIGAGLEVPLSEKISVLFEVRQNFWLTNMSKIEGASTKISSTYATIGLAYML